MVLKPSRSPARRAPATGSPRESGRAEAISNVDAFLPLPFASCFAYLPGGRGAIDEDGRLLCRRLKTADPVWLPRLVAQVWLETMGHGRFAAALGVGAVLVPVPGSSTVQGSLWVGECLAWCLKEVGVAAEVRPVLRRRSAVRKSAFAAAADRPSVLEHYRSFGVEPGLSGGGLGLQLTLVDDVITRGRTLLAAAGRLREAFPGANIRAFALLRALGPDEVLRHVLDPCEGEVRWSSGDARRCP